MTSTLVLIASGILIGAGIGVIWRDARRSRRKAFVLERDQPAVDSAHDNEAEITISHGQTTRRAAYADLPSFSVERAQDTLEPVRPLSQPEKTISVFEQPASQGPEQAHLRAIEQQWSSLQPTIASGVAQVNSVLAAARLSLGTPGEAAWSYRKKGYGAYRRLLLGEESLGWLRIELSADGMLGVNIKAHKDEWAALNGNVSAPAGGLTPTAVSDLLSACLKPAAARAVQFASNGDAHADPADGAWQDVDGVVSAALQAANGALAQTGARLLPLTPVTWDAGLRRHRMTLAVEVDGAEVARMQIERLAHEIEVAVGVRDERMINLGRRRRIPIQGMTTHALAELIAGCAWPAIARFKDVRPHA